MFKIFKCFRFGEVVKVSKVEGNEGASPKFLIDFSNKYGAESALRGGLSFNDKILTAEYVPSSKVANRERTNSNASSYEVLYCYV